MFQMPVLSMRFTVGVVHEVFSILFSTLSRICCSFVISFCVGIQAFAAYVMIGVILAVNSFHIISIFI